MMLLSHPDLVKVVFGVADVVFDHEGQGYGLVICNLDLMREGFLRDASGHAEEMAVVGEPEIH